MIGPAPAFTGSGGGTVKGTNRRADEAHGLSGDLPMNERVRWFGRHAWLVGLLSLLGGCATHRESHTARTGIEQLLVSSAVDQSLDQVDLRPLKDKHVFLQTKYLDCVDKNYVVVSLHHRLTHTGGILVDKPEEADVILEVASGGVGTDSQAIFVGLPEIPLPTPSPTSIPRLSVLTRSRLNVTAKLLGVAYDAKTRAPVIRSGIALARSDMNEWNVLGTGTITSGSVPEQLYTATGEEDINIVNATRMAREALTPPQQAPPVVGMGTPKIRTVSGLLEKKP
jgi:hypothetical protein